MRDPIKTNDHGDASGVDRFRFEALRSGKAIARSTIGIISPRMQTEASQIGHETTANEPKTRNSNKT
jgi:hypothetical protein